MRFLRAKKADVNEWLLVERVFKRDEEEPSRISCYGENYLRGMELSSLKKAIDHDWIIDIGGAEACFEQIYRLYPSDVFSLLIKDESVSGLRIRLMNNVG